MKTALSVTLILLVTGNVLAQSSEELIKKFFVDFEEAGAGQALDNLYGTNPWTVRIQDQIENVKTQLAGYDENLVGTYYGFEKITTKTIGNSYELHSYFLKFDRQFIRLIFQFYKPDNEWRLYSFSFDSNYDEELKESAKIYFLNSEY